MLVFNVNSLNLFHTRFSIYINVFELNNGYFIVIINHTFLGQFESRNVSAVVKPFRTMSSYRLQLISYLLTQKGRSEFLTFAYEIELQGHRDMYRLLTAVSFTLQKQQRAFEQRMVT